MEVYGSTKDDFSEKAERFIFLWTTSMRENLLIPMAKKGKGKDQLLVAIRVCRDLLDE